MYFYNAENQFIWCFLMKYLIRVWVVVLYFFNIYLMYT